jgi:hypothetical protein
MGFRGMTLLWALALFIVLSFAPIRSHAATPLGVYQGNGCTGVKTLPTFVSWFGGKPDFVLDFFDIASWKAMTDDVGWTLRCWSGNNTVVVFSVPMLAKGADTLADGAGGKFDDVFRGIAQQLVKYGYSNAILRLGWEFNGRDFYPWAAAKDPKSFISYWQRIVTVMRGVPGTAFRFDWCPAQATQQINPELAYPGDQYVDIIGQDTYNQTWTPGVTTPEQRWNELMNQPHGLKWHRDFANAHGKLMSFPEWGTGTRADGRGGGDDAYFIEHMASWIVSNRVAYHAYWDHSSSGNNYQLSDDSQAKAGAAFLRIFHGPRPKPPYLYARPVTK